MSADPVALAPIPADHVVRVEPRRAGVARALLAVAGMILIVGANLYEQRHEVAGPIVATPAPTIAGPLVSGGADPVRGGPAAPPPGAGAGAPSPLTPAAAAPAPPTATAPPQTPNPYGDLARQIGQYLTGLFGANHGGWWTSHAAW